MVEFLGKKSAIDAEVQEKIGENIASLNRRLKIMEERVDSLREHLNLVGQSIINKHKESIKEIRDLEADIRNLRANVTKVNQLTERIIKRLGLFATKENLKVLERYINLWKPLDYVTKEEVENIIHRLLKEKEGY